jgi:hypothetical protein
MRSNRLIISALVLFMGLIILSPQAYSLHRFYMAKGDIVTALYEKSEKATNAKDTVAMPFYRFSRQIGPVVQGCFLPFPQLAHEPTGQPIFKELKLKVFATCQDTLILNDSPIAHIILAFLGLLLSALGINLFRLALGSPK